MRFYMGNNFPMDLNIDIIPPEFSNIVQFVNTVPALGPFRDRGNETQLKHDAMSKNRWEDSY
eukprot:CAMPEP_0196589894 /NCGR_PEP_ID=MMETSP1081-20130531/64949_1 /TAXON_ID=36882 /ORGANISM="Pyramimonas amylifera, Strain CCMP720" /LENGTH=61 /DNA_ID=CAMNT_0041912825 /DNA_START=148 /DNA_END=330 /DNA_ORIENTATION=+